MRPTTSAPARAIVEAAIGLADIKGSAFTIQELAGRAGVSLQTFYRRFSGRDELVLAVIEELIAASCERLRASAAPEPDPVLRLRYFVTQPIVALSSLPDAAQRRFVSAEHFRLQQVYPSELGQATAAYADRLLVPELEEAAAAGVLRLGDPHQAAWFINQLLMATFHHYAFSPDPAPGDLADQLWDFCSRAVGAAEAASPP